MKLSKRRLKEIISEELDLLEVADEDESLKATSFDLFDRSTQEPSVTDLDTLIEEVAISVGEAGNQLARALATLEVITEEPHKLGSFVALRTRVKMAQLSIEDVMEKFVRSKENFDQFREEE
jgi:hypothetical protein